MSEFANVPLGTIVASKTNPRTIFNPAKLAELAEGIKSSGVHTPVLLRPLPRARVADTDRGVEYELVAGERRLRASQMAGVPTIPAMIRSMSDGEALEIQLIENVQREDLTELEEAEGLAALMQHSGLTADAVAEKIGKSRRYVFDRLKLLDLTHECKEAMRAGQIDISRAIRIARISNAGLQTKALAEATRPIGAHGDQVLSVRAFESWLRANVMLPLDGAPFVITDARLVKSAGDCKRCPKRTGANPDLYEEVDSADICTDPICYHAKADAHRAAMLTKAEAKGMRLIEGKEAKEICHQTSGKLDGYLPLSQTREDITHGTGDKPATLRTILGKDAPAPVLIENPFTKELIEAVPAAETEALLVMRGLIKATQQQADKVKAAESEIALLQKNLADKVTRAVRETTYTTVFDAIKATPDDQAAALIGGDALREWMQAMLGEVVPEEDMAEMLGYTFEKKADRTAALTMHLNACSTATLLRTLALTWLWSSAGVGDDDTIMQAQAKALNVDTAAIEKAVKQSVKADTAKQIKALQNQLKTTTAAVPTTPPEAPSEGEGGAQGKGKGAARNSKTKITAAEAISGIAVAMQSVEQTASAPVGAVAQSAADDTASAKGGYDAAVALVRKHNKASITLVQRHLQIGYNRAAQLMDQMEGAGVVTPIANDGTRQVIKAPATGFAEGQRVTVSTNKQALGPVSRFAGREGTVAKVLGGDTYQVKLDRGGSVPMFAKQLQAATDVSA